MKIRNHYNWRVTLLGLSLFMPTTSRSAIWGGTDGAEDWEFAFTPYMYSSDLKADVKVNGQEQSFDHANPFDFVTFGTRLRLEAWKGKWGIIGNLHYLNLWDEATLSNASTAEFASNYWGIETAGSWRYLQSDLGTSAPMDLGLELYLGARTAFVNADLDTSTGQSESFNKSYIEPMIGHRIIFGAGEHWNFILKADVGGFGIGSASKLTWDLFPEVVYKLTDGIYLNAGYEIFDLQTESVQGTSKNEVTARTTGPTFGITIHFSTEPS